MPGQRQPGSWGLEPQPGSIDQGTSCLIPTPTPRPVGFEAGWNPPSGGSGPRGTSSFLSETVIETVEDLQKAVGDFERSASWSRLQPIAFRLLGQYSFGLGVVYGIGENVVTSVVDLLQLVKTFLLADLYDRAQQPVFSAASLNPMALVQRLLAEVSMRTFRGELEEAHRERQALIEELRYAMTHVAEVLGNIKDSYVAKWNRFETLVGERTFSSQFEAGRIFGEVLIEVVSLIGGGTAAVKAAGKIPRLAKLARLKIPAKSTAYSGRPAGGAAVREAPLTPSEVHPVPPSAGPKAPDPVTPTKYVWQGTGKSVPLGQLTKAEATAAKVMRDQKRPAFQIRQVLESGENFQVQPIHVGDRLHKFVNAGDRVSSRSAYWVDDATFKSLESKYFRDGKWDSQGVKNELAIPCFNAADQVVTAEVTRDHSIVRSTILSAEDTAYQKTLDGAWTTTAKQYSGGASQVTPDPSAISVVAPR